MSVADKDRHRARTSSGHVGRKRWAPYAAAVTAAALTAGAIVGAGGGTAGAATPPQAQSAGNFLDASLAGKPIDDVATHAFARAEAPGSNGVQNPLDATAFKSTKLPLTGALQFPQLLGIELGAANQVAKAKVDGRSYGAAGAVSNSGGVSVGGDDNAFPADATIDLSASGIAGNSAGAADALGRVQVSLGAVSALARTPVGYGRRGSTSYRIADVGVGLESPLLGSLLGTVSDTLSTALGTLARLAGNVGLPAACTFTDGLGKDVPLEGGAITLDASTAGLTISLAKLLERLGLDLNKLNPNTDLIALLVNYLTSPDGLAKAIQGVVDGLTKPLADKFTACLTALQNSGPIGQVAGLLLQLTDALNSGQEQVEAAISDLVRQLGAAAGSDPLAPLGDTLRKVIDIGVNVQPLVRSGDFRTQLGRLPKQGMTPPAVLYGTVVRALEVNVLPALRTGGVVTFGLANAAAGPSSAPAVAAVATSPHPRPPHRVAATALPIGVPAGHGTAGRGAPVLPAVLLLLGLIFAGGGVVAYRLRGTLSGH
jgi:hypothetical protein